MYAALRFILACLLLIPALSYAEEILPAFEDSAMREAKTHCLNPVIARQKIADTAAKNGARELPFREAVKFGDGRAFSLPAHNKKIIMVANKAQDSCHVFIPGVNAAAFWRVAETHFGAEGAFKLKQLQTSPTETRRAYIADFDGPVSLLVLTKQNPGDGAVHALVTFSREQQP